MTSYADRDEIRQIAGFRRREAHNDLQTGDTEIILSEEAYAVVSILRDGSELTVTTHYTFTEPSLITLVSAVVTGEQFVIEYDTQLSDAKIDLAVRHAKEDVRGELSHVVSDDKLDEWDLKTPDQVTEIATALAILYCEQMVLKANKVYGAERDANRMDIKDALANLKKFRTGEATLVDVDIDYSGIFAIGDGGDLKLVDMPGIDEMLDHSLETDAEEDPAF